MGAGRRARAHDAQGQESAKKGAEPGHGKGKRDAEGGPQRRRGHGYERVEAGGENRLFNHGGPQRDAAQPGQRAAPQRDDGGEDRMLADRRLSALGLAHLIGHVAHPQE